MNVAEQNAADFLRMWKKLARIRMLCESNMVESVTPGVLTDADTIWPSDILAILDGTEEDG